MTDLDPLSDPPAGALLVIEAFLDGEAVTRDALEAALDDAAAREHLVDLLVLRGGVAALGPSAWSAVRPSQSRRRRWLAAAAVVVLSVGTGFFAGQRTIDATAAPSVEAVVEQGAETVAPKPTRVIDLQPGVNWTESTGGR